MKTKASVFQSMTGAVSTISYPEGESPESIACRLTQHTGVPHKVYSKCGHKRTGQPFQLEDRGEDWFGKCSHCGEIVELA
jgi:hypothetical protein